MICPVSRPNGLATEEHRVNSNKIWQLQEINQELKNKFSYTHTRLFIAAPFKTVKKGKATQMSTTS